MALWVAGIIGGVIGGLVMAMLATMLMPMMGKSATSPMRLMAATIEGEGAMTGGMSTIVLGMMIHLATSIALGVIYGFIVAWLGWSRFWVIFVLGGVYGILVWLVMQYLVLPRGNRLMARKMPPMPWLMLHIVYGLVLGLFVWVFK